MKNHLSTLPLNTYLKGRLKLIDDFYIFLPL